MIGKDTQAQECRVTTIDGDVLGPGEPVNTLSDDGAESEGRAYPPDKLARLTAFKDHYDPENAFHLNHNIRPSDRRRP